MSEQTLFAQQNPPVFSGRYWKMAVKNFSDVRMLVFAAFIIALRIAVKFLKIPIAPNLNLSLDCYVNAVGSIIYGPLVGLVVGAVSDTLGFILHPTGVYFFPFIFVEMLSSFIFALYLWKRELSVLRVMASKFTVSFICNIILTSIFTKWSLYLYSGVEDAQAYALINLVRIGKNLVLFPFEAVVITLILAALTPAFRSLKLLPKTQEKLKIEPKHVILIIVLTLFSVALILLYVFFLKDFLSVHNIKIG